MPDFLTNRRQDSRCRESSCPSTMPIGAAIDELAFNVEASDPSEWVDRVVYLPLP